MAIAQIDSRIQAFALKLGIPKWLFLLLVQFIILNFLMSLIFGIPDYPYYLDHLTFLKRNINPYVEDSYYSKYPAAYFLFMGILGILGINSFYGLKMVFALFDVLNLVILYKICCVRLKFPSDARIMAILSVYFYNFLHLINRITGENDVVAISMLLLAVYFFLGEAYSKSAIFLSLGINFKVFPIFFLIPASLFFLKNHKIKDGIYYWLIQAFGFLLISFYYIIKNPMAFIRSLLVHTNRITTGFSWARMIQPVYSIAIEIFGIQMSYMFIIQISVLFLITLIGWFRTKEFGSSELIYFTLLVMSLYPLITNYDVHPIFDKIIPFAMILIIAPDAKQFHMIMKFSKIMFVFTFIALSVFLVAQNNQLVHWEAMYPNDYLAYFNNPLYDILRYFSVVMFLVCIVKLVGIKNQSFYYVLFYNLIYLLAVEFVSIGDRDDLYLAFIIRVLLHLCCIMFSVSIFKKFKTGTLSECEDMERSEESVREKDAVLYGNPKFVILKIAYFKQTAERISILEKCASYVDKPTYFKVLREIQMKAELIEEDPLFFQYISEEIEKLNDMKGVLNNDEN